QLNAARVAGQAEGIQCQIELQQARLQLAEAEGNRSDGRKALDELVRANERLFIRAVELKERGVATGAEVDEAEIRYQEAIIHRASADSKLAEVKQALEQIATTKARAFERMKALAAAGVVPAIEVAAAEADWKLAQA